MFDALKRSIIGRILGKIDAEGLSRWPVGWIKVRRAARGWKLIIGTAVYYTPDILLWANDTLPGILPAFGVEDSAPIIKGVGALLVAIGAAHKALKFMGPVDRREDARKAAIIEKIAVVDEVKKDVEVLPEGTYTKAELDREVKRRLKDRA